MKIQLSEKQLSKIQYECNLMKISLEQMYIIAPYMFDEPVADVIPVTTPTTKASEDPLEDNTPTPPTPLYISDEEFDPSEFYGYSDD